MPKLIDFGILIMYDFDKVTKDSKRLCGYYIMPKYQVNLEEYMKDLKGVKRAMTILEVAIQLLPIFQLVHKSNRTFNDLKPENIMVDKKYASHGIKVHLVDFGFADKFISDHTGKHIDEKEALDMFQGNLMYASLDQMSFYRTSRRDDLLSLFYLIVHLLNNNSFVCNNEYDKILM